MGQSGIVRWWGEREKRQAALSLVHNGGCLVCHAVGLVLPGHVRKWTTKESSRGVGRGGKVESGAYTAEAGQEVKEEERARTNFDDTRERVAGGCGPVVGKRLRVREPEVHLGLVWAVPVAT